MVKTISFRLIATLTTILIVYIMTGSYTIAGQIGLIEGLSKLVLYYFHERMWLKISWGNKGMLEPPHPKSDKYPRIRD
ncbi:MAG: DUF2061 domain-containing protein [Candidatus Bathyarchaeota archaeon]|jgi:uncharacterized membrane protein